jgi:hypothetical protein
VDGRGYSGRPEVFSRVGIVDQTQPDHGITFDAVMLDKDEPVRCARTIDERPVATAWPWVGSDTTSIFFRERDMTMRGI